MKPGPCYRIFTLSFEYKGYIGQIGSMMRMRFGRWMHVIHHILYYATLAIDPPHRKSADCKCPSGQE